MRISDWSSDVCSSDLECAARLSHRKLLRRRGLCPRCRLRLGSRSRSGKEISMKRLHVHVGVENLDQSIGFYSTLFGAEPAVVKQDYAKWMLEDPRVNFAISAGNHAAKGIEHLGIQVENQEELAERSEEHTSELQSLMRISYAVFCLKK